MVLVAIAFANATLSNLVPNTSSISLLNRPFSLIFKCLLLTLNNQIAERVRTLFQNHKRNNCEPTRGMITSFQRNLKLSYFDLRYIFYF